MHVKGVRKVARANPMAKNQRRRAQEALFSPAPSTTPPEEEKAAEHTETPEKPIEQHSDDKCYFKLNLSNDEREELERAYATLTSSPITPAPSPADYISEKYGIEPNCTNVPRLLYAILCEVVRRRV